MEDAGEWIVQAGEDAGELIVDAAELSWELTEGVANNIGKIASSIVDPED